jgi:hypothetical protein
MFSLPQSQHRLVIAAILKRRHTWDKLVMKARCRKGICSRHTVIKDMPDCLNACGGDPRTACGSDDVVEGVVGGVLYDDWGAGRERAFARADVVGGCGIVSEFVTGAGEGEVWDVVLVLLPRVL